MTLSNLLSNLLKKFGSFSERGITYLTTISKSEKWNTITESDVDYFVKFMEVTRLLLIKTTAQTNPLLLDEVVLSNYFKSLCCCALNLSIGNQSGVLISCIEPKFTLLNKIKEEVFCMLKYSLKRLLNDPKKNNRENLIFLSNYLLDNTLNLIVHDLAEMKNEPLKQKENCLIELLLCYQKIIRNSLFFEKVFRLRDFIIF